MEKSLIIAINTIIERNNKYEKKKIIKTDDHAIHGFCVGFERNYFSDSAIKSYTNRKKYIRTHM